MEKVGRKRVKKRKKEGGLLYFKGSYEGREKVACRLLYPIFELRRGLLYFFYILNNSFMQELDELKEVIMLNFLVNFNVFLVAKAKKMLYICELEFFLKKI